MGLEPRWNEREKEKSRVHTEWCTPLILALGRQRQADLCDCEATLVYKT